MISKNIKIFLRTHRFSQNEDLGKYRLSLNNLNTSATPNTVSAQTKTMCVSERRTKTFSCQTFFLPKEAKLQEDLKSGKIVVPRLKQQTDEEVLTTNGVLNGVRETEMKEKTKRTTKDIKI